MKKFLLFAFILVVSYSYSSVEKGDPKEMIWGIIDIYGQEFNKENIVYVKFRAWLTTGDGPEVGELKIVTQDDPGNSVEVLEGVRGICRINLSNFDTWGKGNVLHVDIGDQNGG
jgi:hypothetical protein